MDAAKKALSCQTADEESLRGLARRSSEFTPALTKLRETAVDRAVLARLSQDEAMDSDGESSAYEFALSDDEVKQNANVDANGDANDDANGDAKADTNSDTNGTDCVEK